MEGETLLGKKFFQSMETRGDVKFVVGPPGEEEEVKSSSFLLRTLSPVFDSMFDEKWKSQDKPVKLPDIKPTVFRHFLELLLTDNLTVDHLNPLELSMEETLNLLYTANKYDISPIQSVCRSAIKNAISIKNVVDTYNQLLTMNESELEKTVLDFMIENIEALLVEESFYDLSAETLTKILSSEELHISELSLFKGLVRWAECKSGEKCIRTPANGRKLRKTLGKLLRLIRFPVMTPKDFFNTVKPTGILTLEEVVSVSECHALKRDPKLVNSSPFKVKRRIRGKGELTKEELPPLSEYLVLCPDDKISLQDVCVSISNMYGNSGYSSNYYNYTVNICILDDSWDILLDFKKTIPNTSSWYLQFNLETTFDLEPNSTYYIRCDVMRNGSMLKQRPHINGSRLSVYY